MKRDIFVGTLMALACAAFARLVFEVIAIAIERAQAFQAYKAAHKQADDMRAMFAEERRRMDAKRNDEYLRQHAARKEEKGDGTSPVHPG